MRRVLGVVLWAVRRRAEALAAGAVATGLGREKGPADEGPAGHSAYLIQNLQLILKRHSY